MAGRFQLVLWLHIDKCCPWDASIVRLAAARHGQEEICIWLWRQADVRWRRNDMMCQYVKKMNKPSEHCSGTHNFFIILIDRVKSLFFA